MYYKYQTDSCSFFLFSDFLNVLLSPPVLKPRTPSLFQPEHCHYSCIVCGTKGLSTHSSRRMSSFDSVHITEEMSCLKCASPFVC